MVREVDCYWICANNVSSHQKDVTKWISLFQFLVHCVRKKMVACSIKCNKCNIWNEMWHARQNLDLDAQITYSIFYTQRKIQNRLLLLPWQMNEWRNKMMQLRDYLCYTRKLLSEKTVLMDWQNDTRKSSEKKGDILTLDNLQSLRTRWGLLGTNHHFLSSSPYNLICTLQWNAYDSPDRVLVERFIENQMKVLATKDDSLD